MSTSASPLATVARLFERAVIPYAVIGAHAVNVWVEPRLTADIDVTVAADAEGMARFERTLVQEGWSVARTHGAGQPSGPDFVRFVSPSAVMTLEVQTAKTHFQQDVIRRAAVADDGVRVASPHVERRADAWDVRQRLEWIRLRG